MDVLVVGAGPAGSTMAGLLARRGWSVVLAERARFPRPKACGACMNPGSVAVLARLGLLDAVRALRPSRLTGWEVRVDGARAAASFPDHVHGLAVPRTRLDHALARAAVRRGARLMEGVRALDVRPAGSGGRPAARLLSRDRSAGAHAVDVRPRIIVGADGLRSGVARSLGLVRPAPARRVSFTFHVRLPASASGSAGAASRERGILSLRPSHVLGFAPLEPSEGGSERLWNATLVVPAGARARHVSRDPARALSEALLTAGERAGRVVDGPWCASGFALRVKRPWAPGVVLIGDAAGYFDPLTGQGIYRALRTAELAAEAVHLTLSEAGAECPSDQASPPASDPAWRHLRAYARRRRREVAPSRRLQRLIDGVVDHPRLLRQLLPALARAGLLGRLFTVTGDAAPVRSLVLPAFLTPSRAAPPC